MWRFFGLVLVVAFVVAASTTALANEERVKPRSIRRGRPTAHPRFLSLTHACKDDIARMCLKDGRLQQSATNCLSVNVKRIESTACLAWIEARNVCFSDVERFVPECLLEEKGAPKRSKRACLRTIPQATLSKDCANSEFYASVMRFAKYDKQPTQPLQVGMQVYKDG